MSKRFVILLGPPCAGKSTQADYLINQYQIKCIAIGKQLRKLAKENIHLANTINNGHMASNDIVNKILLNNINDQHDWYLLDGYPRIQEQVTNLTDLFPCNNNSYYIVKFNVDNNVLLDRMNTRSQCTICTKIYSTYNINCCNQLTKKRIDDNLQAFQPRINNYQNNIQTILNILQPASLLEIDGNQPIHIVQNLLSRYFSTIIPHKN